MPIISIFDYIGTLAFALSGASVAIQKRLDVFGIYVVAAVTAVGGGITRDVVMDKGVPIIFSSYTTIALIVIAASLAILMRGNFRWNKYMDAFDAIGLSVFVIDTGVKAIHLGYNLPQFFFVSIITGVGGGVIRDLLCQRVPVILRREVYASAGIAGALFLWFAHPYIGMDLAMYSAMAMIVIIRMYSVIKNVNLPVVSPKTPDPDVHG